MHSPSATGLLQQLVRIPSVNPGVSDLSPEIAGEKRLVDFLESLLGPVADRVERIEVAPGRENFFAYFQGMEDGPPYVLEAHSDTVGIAGMTIDPFGAEIREGRLYGRGACDTKGPMCGMLCALLRAFGGKERPRSSWLFISTCDEELGGLGAAHLAASGLDCRGVIVGEPTKLEWIDRHLGAERFELTVRGRAAHSASPELGINAIHGAADWIHRIEKAFATSPDRSRSTANVGIIAGGEQVNRIPDEVVMQLDVRTPPEMPPGEVESRVSALAGEVMAARPGLVCEWQQNQLYPPFLLPEDSPFRSFLADQRKRIGSTGSFALARYATNAGFLARANIPAVVFGPGDAAAAHTADEWVDLAQVEEATGLLETIVQTA